MPNIDDGDCRVWRELAYRFGRHWGCTKSDAEDVAQQALLAALKAGKAAFTHGWFFVTTRRLSTRMRARAQRERVMGTLPTSLVGPDDSTLLLREIEELRILKPVEHGLLREILEGRTHAEIASSFGWNPKSVGVRVQRLVRKIQSVVLQSHAR